MFRLKSILILLTFLVNYGGNYSPIGGRSGVSFVSLGAKSDSKNKAQVLDLIDNEQLNGNKNLERKYRYLTLQNQLQVFLVSDPYSTKSSAILNVGVGSASDPKTLPGLAHLVEHSLLVNSKRFPEAGSLRKLIQIYSGSLKSFTDINLTNFEMIIDSKYFPDTMERFSDFFISPLFDKKNIEKALDSLENEFANKMTLDHYKFKNALSRVFGSYDINSLFSKDTFGNLNMVVKSQRVDIKSEVANFFKSQYSSNRMILVLSGSITLDELQQIAQNSFGKLQNSHLPTMMNYVPLKKFSQNSIAKSGGKIIVFQGNHARQVELVFPVQTNLKKIAYYQFSDVISSYLDSKREGSLFNYLTRENLVSDIRTEFFDKTISYGYYKISLLLSEEGAESIHLVLKSVFSMIRFMDNPESMGKAYEEINKYHEESQKANREKSLHKECKMILNNRLQFNSSPKDSVSDSHTYPEFDYSSFSELISGLDVDRMILVIQNGNIGDLRLRLDASARNTNESAFHSQRKVQLESVFKAGSHEKDANVEQDGTQEFMMGELNPELISYLKAPVMNSEDSYLFKHLTENEQVLASNFERVIYPDNQYHPEILTNSFGATIYSKYDSNDEPAAIISHLSKVEENVSFNNYIYLRYMYPTELLYSGIQTVDNKTTKVLVLSNLMYIMLAEMFSNDFRESESKVQAETFNVNGASDVKFNIFASINEENHLRVLGSLFRYLQNFHQIIDENKFRHYHSKYVQYLNKLTSSPDLYETYNSMREEVYFNQNISPSALLAELNAVSHQELTEFVKFFFLCSSWRIVIRSNFKHGITNEEIGKNRGEVCPYNHLLREVKYDLQFNANKELFNKNSQTNKKGAKKSGSENDNRQITYTDPKNYVENASNTFEYLQALDLMSAKSKRIFHSTFSDSPDVTSNFAFLNVAMGYSNLKNFIMTNILATFISAYFQYEFGFEKQVGHIVETRYFEYMERVSGIQFLLVSSNYNIDDLSKFLTEFWRNYASNKSGSIDEVLFNAAKKSVLNNILDQPGRVSDIQLTNFMKEVNKQRHEVLELMKQKVRDMKFRKFTSWLKTASSNSVEILFAIQSSNLNGSSRQYLESYLPLKYTRFSGRDSLFSSPNVSSFNLFQIIAKH
ncbi:peptidase'insulinase-like peptidase' [Cryptosporidium canis]|uniref:Peptidase'insulinase-like peptidase n=1 Tax=Cryptosporidium canis TaxID=195482 RepID=A0ABQ8P4T0_9CRYT|nr:peptidase'insulinase-like peptidase' [Cryptosporidium canis]